MPEHAQEVKRLFNAALEQEPAHRADFLVKNCAGNESLRREVAILVERYSQDEGLMETPAINMLARRMADSASSDKSSSLVDKDISHFRILQELGSGGMGVVYKAYDTKLGRHVALKFLFEGPSSDRRSLERFRGEARAASALNNPHICTIYEIDEFEGQTFTAMELLEGKTLKERIGSKPLPVSEVLDFGRQIAAGLDAAHSKGIIHRDIKPDNIFITNQEQVKILDFGLAKLLQEDSQNQHETPSLPTGAGTPLYMSPQQSQGEELDTRTDVWSLGVTLYEMATGTLPFANKEAILHADPVAPSRINFELPRQLDRIIAGTLKKNISDRTLSARQVAAELASVDRELICLLDLASPVLDRNLIHLLNKWAESHSMVIRYVVLPGPEHFKVTILNDVNEDAAKGTVVEKEADWMQKLGIADANLISWDEMCDRVNFKAAFQKISSMYLNDAFFRNNCRSQVYSDLQQRFKQMGVQNKGDERVRVDQWIDYLLEELALKVGAFESGEFHGEILLGQERRIVRRVYAGIYFPCSVSNRGFEVISLTRSRISRSQYIHENEAGMLGFALQFYIPLEPQDPSA